MRRAGIFIMLIKAVLCGSFLYAQQESQVQMSHEEIMSHIAESQERFAYIEEKRAARLDGREAVVRVYQNWEGGQAGYELRYARLEGMEVVPQFDDLKGPAIVVMAKEDQDDKEVLKNMGDYIFADVYSDELRFKIPRSGSFSFKFEIQDARGTPLSNAQVQVYLNSEEPGSEDRVWVREIVLDEYGILKAPSITGSINRLYFEITHPDNAGVFLLDLEALGLYRDIASFSHRPKLIRVPWVNRESEFYEHSLWGRVVDDANRPVGGAAIKTDLILSHQEHKSWVMNQLGLRLLSDEDGAFSFYLPHKEDEKTSAARRGYNRKYQIQVDAPRELELASFIGTITDPQDIEIQLRPECQFHTFTFRDSNRVIDDERKLSAIKLQIKREDKPTLNYKYEELVGGFCVPTGTYIVDMPKYDFEPLEVTAESPEELIMSISKTATYSGVVVNGMTKETIQGAFVLGCRYHNVYMSRKDAPNFTVEDWESIEQIQDGADDSLLRGLFFYDKMVRTDANGWFEIASDPGGEFNMFLILKKDFILTQMDIQPILEFDAGKRMQLPTVALFPAGKVTFVPIAPAEEVRLECRWRIDESTAPEWVGAPKLEPKQAVLYNETHTVDLHEGTVWQSTDMNVAPVAPGYVLMQMLQDLLTTPRVSIFGFPIMLDLHYYSNWPGEPVAGDVNESMVFNAEGNEPTIADESWFEESYVQGETDVNAIPTLYSIVSGWEGFAGYGVYSLLYCGSSRYGNNLNSGEACTIHVPAGVDVTLTVRDAYRLENEYKWASIVSQPVNVKQAERLSLGELELQAAPQVFVKVVDSTGRSVPGIPVRHYIEAYGLMGTKLTDESGKASFYSRYEDNFRFVVGDRESDSDFQDVLRYSMTNEDKSGKQFTMKVRDKVFLEISKQN